jgi:hypothetical protein
MKNKIYLIGLVSLSLTVLGGIFKIMHWPGAGWLMILGYASLCFLFFPLALRSSFIGDGKKRIGLYIAAFIALFADFLGALFKIMHWPGAGWMMVFGITFPVIVFLPVYIYFHVRDKEKSLVNFMYIMFLLVYLGVMSAFLAVRVQKEVLSDSVRVAYITNNDGYYSLKREMYAESSIAEIESKTLELVQYIDGLKIELAQLMNDDGTSLKEDGSVNLWLIKGKDNYSVPLSVMLEGSDEHHSGKAYELKIKIEDYKTLLKSYSDNDAALQKKIDDVLEIREYSFYDETVTWESYHFKYKTIVHVLGTLELIAEDVRQAELEVLNYLSHN